MELKIESNIVFTHLKNNENPNGGFKKRIVIEQGGTRSGKTYNILIWLVVYLLNCQGKTIDIVRKTMPSLKISARQDFFEILHTYNLYNSKHENKSDNSYTLNGNLIRFMSMDDPQKKRGPGRDILICNEMNELTEEDFKQLNMRTRELVIGDYNPSDEYGWFYDLIEQREGEDLVFHQTTYKDNPFLPPLQVKEIEHLKHDPNYWRIYGLGERGISESTIFNNWRFTNEKKPSGYNAVGQDYGYNDPSTIMDVVIVDGEKPYIWIDELFYLSYKTTPDIINFMQGCDVIDRNTSIFGDNAEADRIREISRAGFNIKPCVKGKGSIKQGIDWLKRYELRITKRSVNTLKEIKSYKWKVNRDGRILDEPVDYNNHAIDAIRYALTEKITMAKKRRVVVGKTRIF